MSDVLATDKLNDMNLENSIVGWIVARGYICNRLADGQDIFDTPGTLFCRLQIWEEHDVP